jgi:hypothetical protein
MFAILTYKPVFRSAAITVPFTLRLLIDGLINDTILSVGMISELERMWQKVW